MALTLRQQDEVMQQENARKRVLSALRQVAILVQGEVLAEDATGPQITLHNRRQAFAANLLAGMAFNFIDSAFVRILGFQTVAAFGAVLAMSSNLLNREDETNMDAVLTASISAVFNQLLPTV